MWLNRIGIAVWIASLFFFWQWWFDPEHVASVSRYVLVTVVLLWVTLIPAYFIFIFSRARVPAEPAAVPCNARVAMIVTKAPSEPLSVVKQTLKAALAQKGVAHDTWLADEDPTPETLSWCEEHGIRVSTRRGVKEYHQPDWPRRTRCKEGNLAYFYDHYGYETYDFVSQFDADHAPDPDYLRHAVAPFRDPSVGYVSAPSICDTNADLSWAARGRLYVEASMHGALQTGYNSGWAPLCIGSHYTVRTAALKQVGGLGPELAEDHSTTLLMNAGGWRGVHAVDAIAHGEGPETFADLAVQEFQWSRSLVTILLKYSPDYVPNLPGRIRFQFLFSQMWYPLFSVMMALMFFLPIYALLSGEKFANVTFLEFQLHVLPVGLALIFLAYFWRSTGLFRPRDAKIISWEGTAFMFLRWPWSLLGALAAVWDVATGQKRDFKITPKGGSHKEGLSFLFLAPYVVLALAAGGTALFVREPGTAAGFYLYNLVNAAAYCVLLVVILMRHGRENGTSVVPFDRSGLAGVFCLFLIAGVVGGATYQNSAKGVSAMMTGVSAFSLTETVFGFAGAGQGSGRTIIRYRFEWHGFGQAETDAVSMELAPSGRGSTSLDSKQ
jgi:cellulose synthase (UDP-forming)